MQRKLLAIPFALALASLSVLSLPCANLTAQSTADLFPELSMGKYGQPAFGADQQGEPVTWEASYKTIDAGAGMFVIEIRGELTPPWHIYSLTQPKGGPSPTKLKLKSADSFELLGPWKADREPAKSISEEFGGITIEEFGEEVVFTAPAWLKTPGDSIESIGEIEITVDALACISGGSCMPIEETLVAEYGGELTAEQAIAARNGVTERVREENRPDPSSMVDAAELEQQQQDMIASLPIFRDEDYSVAWKAWIADATLKPGQQTKIFFTAIPDETIEEKYHIYPGTVDDTAKSTNFAISDKAGLKIGIPTTDAKIVVEEPIPGLVNVYHEGEVTWSLPIQVPEDATPGDKTVVGSVAYQACTNQSCLLPMAISFEVPVAILPADVPDTDEGVSLIPMMLTSSRFGDAMKLAGNSEWVDKIVEPEPTPGQIADAGVAEPIDSELATTGPGSEKAVSFPLTLGLAFLGGIILNFMPCVLPVVGLKVMSFVQQAGEDRRRVLMLNLVYALGILAVFALLAGLAVVFSFSWGEQFTYVEFRLGLTILMFALALSYLGVWEIPAPSFASSKTSQDLGAKEGYIGAFFKGVFATLMATPCSGPLLGYILGATINLSPVQTVAIMMMVGVGMALPYLIIGARPSLVSWLPKPGNWMETLKEFLAFLFLGTVVFFFYGFSDETKVAVFATLIGVWFGCWVIGKVPSWQSIQRRVAAWAVGVSAATAIGMWSFTALIPGEEIIRWQPYSEARLDDLLAEGKTVVLDFTADWCVNCKVNERYALNTEPTKEMLEELDAVAMVADWSDRENPEIKEKLRELQSRSIPVLAIYPGNSPDAPIILRDLVTQQMVLTALEQAGPSQASETRVALIDK